MAFDLSNKKLYESLTAGFIITEEDIKHQLEDRYQEYENYSQEQKEEIESLIKQTKFKDYVNGLVDSADIKVYLKF